LSDTARFFKPNVIGCKIKQAMEHLEFVNALDKTGVSIRGTDVEGREKKFVINKLFNDTNVIIHKNHQLRWEKPEQDDPLRALIKMAIDMDSWKHSWHNEITPENYDKFREIIQGKILERAKEIETLLTVYFQINYEKVRCEGV